MSETKDRPTMQEIMINLVRDLRRRSTCQRRQQSCVIVDENYTRVYAIGYNGKARGEPHGCDELVSGKCGCVHTEANALVKVGNIPDNDAILICTQSPCVVCARLVVNFGKIKKFIYLEDYHDQRGVQILKNANIVTELKLS